MKTMMILGVALMATTAFSAAQACEHGTKASHIHGKWHYTNAADAGASASVAHKHNGVVYYSSDKAPKAKAAAKQWTHSRAHTSTIGFEDHDRYGN